MLHPVSDSVWAIKMVNSYLSQSYEWFLGRHSADLGKNILGEVGKVIKGGVEAMMNLELN